MKLFVAGASGAIGRQLLPMLLNAGHEVVGMTRHPQAAADIRSLGAQAVVADALNRAAVIEAVAAARPDAIMHQLTALSDWNLADNARIRIEGTRHLVDAAKAAGVSRMIAQSIAWAYEPGDGPAVEDTPLDREAPQPRRSTIDGVVALEEAAAELPIGVILRYGMLYGPGTWYARGGLMAERVMARHAPATDGVTSWLHVEDAARAALLALDWPAGTYNIVDDEPAAGTQWLPVYAEALGAPAPAYQPGGNRGERGALNAKARRYCGWEPLHPTWRSGFGLAERG